ncbi:MAG: RDD family protein [Rhodothermales bacterium]
MDETYTLHAKADLGKRFIAQLIDGLAAGLLGALVGIFSATLGGIAGAVYFLVRDGLELDFMHHRSLGKHVMGLRVVRLDGEAMDLETSLQRNWMWAISGLISASFFGGYLVAIVSTAATVLAIYEIYKVVTDDAGRRWGDEMANTQVVE